MDATYDLNLFRSLVIQGKYAITRTALDTALALGFDEVDIVECVCNELNVNHFYKTMMARRVPGLWQDVYKIRYEGQRVYLKLQINSAKTAVVVSFKVDTSRD